VNGEKRLLVIGASSGGPAALTKLLSGLPKDFPVPIVIVQHMDEQFASGMADWLGQHAPWPVKIAQANDRLAVGTVWLASAREHLILKRSETLDYVTEPAASSYRPSIDVFFQSVNRFWHGSAVAVLLTGMGRDGALGLKALRDKGHHTIAQDAASSAVYGMPKAAAELRAAVEILPLDRIAPRLCEIFL
jgi:two-component system response regulator WspF